MADYIIIVILCIVVLDFLMLSIYCRVMEKIDNKRSIKMQEMEKSGNTSTAPKKRNLLKYFAKIMLDHYIYGLMRYSIIQVGKIPSFRIRNLLYRYVFNMKITKRTVIYGGCEIRSPWNLFADNCVIANNCLLDCRNKIVIGQNVVFGGGVHVWTEQHDVKSPTFQVTARCRGPVVIDEHAWICSDSTILPGVHVGEGAVLASRACATKDLEEFSVYAGIPAKRIGDRETELIYKLSGKPHWHFY